MDSTLRSPRQWPKNMRLPSCKQIRLAEGVTCEDIGQTSQRYFDNYLQGWLEVTGMDRYGYKVKTGPEGYILHVKWKYAETK